MIHPKIAEQRRVWESKPALRAVYGDYAHRLQQALVPGVTAEVGAGSGWLGELLPISVRTDLVRTPWVDVQASAEDLPFARGSLGNVVGVDVLHHLPRPRRFFHEVERVLRPGGRCALVEPAITPMSRPFFNQFHDEVVNLRADPLADQDPTGRDPFDANQAIPTLLFGTQGETFQRAFPSLRVHQVAWFSLVAYPLSGGFRSWSLIPARWVPALIRAEGWVERTIGAVAGFRMMVVIEKSGP